jgi:hypothetical protein
MSDDPRVEMANDILDLYKVPPDGRPEDPKELMGMARSTVLLSTEQISRIEDVQLAVVGDVDDNQIEKGLDQIEETMDQFGMEDLGVTGEGIKEELEDGQFNLTQVRIFDEQGEPLVQVTKIEGEEVLQYAEADLSMEEMEELWIQAYDNAGEMEDPGQLGTTYYIQSSVIDNQTQDGTIAASITSQDIEKEPDTLPKLGGPGGLDA